MLADREVTEFVNGEFTVRGDPSLSSRALRLFLSELPTSLLTHVHMRAHYVLSAGHYLVSTEPPDDYVLHAV